VRARAVQTGAVSTDPRPQILRPEKRWADAEVNADADALHLIPDDRLVATFGRSAPW
jgi:hypothetical protein